MQYESIIEMNCNKIINHDYYNEYSIIHYSNTIINIFAIFLTLFNRIIFGANYDLLFWQLCSGPAPVDLPISMLNQMGTCSRPTATSKSHLV